MSLALQGTQMGLVVHAMEGFDYMQARIVCKVPEEYQIEAMVAVGYPGRTEDLPQALQDRGYQPTLRKPLKEIVFEGSFPQ